MGYLMVLNEAMARRARNVLRRTQKELWRNDVGPRWRHAEFRKKELSDLCMNVQCSEYKRYQNIEHIEDVCKEEHLVSSVDEPMRV